MKTFFYVLGYPDNDTGYQLVMDLEDVPDATLISNVFCKKIYTQIYNMYQPRKNRKYIKVLKSIISKKHLKKWIFAHCYEVSKINFRKEAVNCLVMINSGFCFGYTKEYIQYLREKVPNVYMVLYQLDPTEIFYKSLYNRMVFDDFDLIYNINRKEAKVYDQIYWPLICSKNDADMKASGNIVYDLYFIGFGSDRSNILEEMYINANKKNIRTKFIVFYFDEKQYKGVEKINTRMEYKKNLNFIRESNCLLEILHDGYQNVTQRYVEAILYSKKLLTNNEEIKTYPFYNEKYMKIFKNISDIDWNWVCLNEEVKYGYHDEFSPKVLLTDLERRIYEDRRTREKIELKDDNEG